MARFKSLRNWGTLLTILLMMAMLNACSEKDLYESGDGGGQTPATDQVFGFETTVERSLYVDYDAAGYKSLIEVYAENPVETVNGNRMKKEGVNALFKAYTDDNCKFDGKMPIPSDLDKVYLYTSYLGLPECVELPVVDGKASFDLPALVKEAQSAQPSQVATRGNATGGHPPYGVDKSKNFYSLCKWNPGHYGIPTEDGYLSYVKKIGDEPLSNLIYRLQAKLKGFDPDHKYDNTKYLSGEEKTNITIAKVAADGTPIIGANVDLVFLCERAGYQSALGYYYYKTGTTPDINSIPKYVIFPNVSQKGDDPFNGHNLWNAPLDRGTKVRLKFFGEDYKAEKPLDQFAPGYTIGWFLIADAFSKSKGVDVNKPIYYSNKSLNKGEDRCITLYDKRSQKIIVGFEDGESGRHDRSYEDVLFYIESDPIKAIIDPENPDVPSIDGDGEIVYPDVTMKKSGTLAFEDLWPSQGDYDLNDVVLTYQSTLTFDKDNKIVKIEDVFTPINDGAGVQSSFGYQLDGVRGTDIKDVLIERPDWATKPTDNLEPGQANAVIRLYDNVRNAFTPQGYKGGKFKVTIDFYNDKNNAVDKSLVIPPYNPFIITDNKTRKEVHLPKKAPTSLADRSMFGTHDDKSQPEKGLYYISSSYYPFALDLPIMDYQVPAEKQRIDVVYPRFVNWAASQGVEDADWYKKK